MRTQRARNATSVSRPCTRAREKASCEDVRVEITTASLLVSRASRTCRAWLEQAKILFAEAEENNLGAKVLDERWNRWEKCSLCEQDYHGVVRCALGWACWKAYVGRRSRER